MFPLQHNERKFQLEEIFHFRLFIDKLASIQVVHLNWVSLLISEHLNQLIHSGHISCHQGEFYLTLVKNLDARQSKR